jgi:hypothetical protein
VSFARTCARQLESVLVGSSGWQGINVPLRGVVPRDHARSHRSAIAGRLGYLRGLEGNVIVGRLIPAGTGMPVYREVYLEKDEPAPQPTLEDLLQCFLEEVPIPSSMIVWHRPDIQLPASRNADSSRPALTSSGVIKETPQSSRSHSIRHILPDAETGQLVDRDGASETISRTAATRGPQKR